MSKLLEHFRAMQVMAGAFIQPGEYVARDGSGYDKETGRRKGFSDDMVYMLDGPEQRDAEAEYEDFLAKVSHDRLESATKFGAMEQRWKDTDVALINATAEVNDLRSRLMASELAYAKLRGYLDRVVDEEPPIMVPQHREPMHAQMPDGTASYGGWRGDKREWFHK